MNRLLATALVAGGVLALSACSTPSANSPSAGDRVTVTVASLSDVIVAPPEGEVLAQGMIIDPGGAPRLCDGLIMESFPPQCNGTPLRDWSWDGLDGSETAGDASWGSYAIQGLFDGETFQVTEPPILLALYDPAPLPDPGPTAAPPADQETLLGIQEELTAALGNRTPGIGIRDGRVVVPVVWDDGSLQEAIDAVYGPGVVRIESALREISG